MIETISLIRHLAEDCQLLRQCLQQMIFRFKPLAKIEKPLTPGGDSSRNIISSGCLAHEFEEEINETLSFLEHKWFGSAPFARIHANLIPEKFRVYSNTFQNLTPCSKRICVLNLGLRISVI